MSFRQGYVVASHPEDHSVDLVMMDDGSRLTGVQVLSANGSTRSGVFSQPVAREKANKWDITQRTDQDQIAMVGFVRNNPVVVGFLFPQISQMTFKDELREMDRHESDFYQTIDGSANFEMFHPSGAFLRIAESAGHEDLTGRNFDKNFQIDRNTSRRPWFNLSLGGASISISPEGVVRISAPEVIVLDAPLVSVPNGSVVASGDVTGSGVSLVGHVHGGVVQGGDVTGAPVS